MVSMASEVLTAHILSAWPGYGVYGVCWSDHLDRRWVVGAMVSMVAWALESSVGGRGHGGNDV